MHIAMSISMARESGRVRERERERERLLEVDSTLISLIAHIIHCVDAICSLHMAWEQHW